MTLEALSMVRGKEETKLSVCSRTWDFWPLWEVMGWGRAGLAAPAMRRLHPAGAVGHVEVQQVQGSAGEKLGSRVVALGGPGGLCVSPGKKKK